jgi:hypothetical protein
MVLACILLKRHQVFFSSIVSRSLNKRIYVLSFVEEIAKVFTKSHHRTFVLVHSNPVHHSLGTVSEFSCNSILQQMSRSLENVSAKSKTQKKAFLPRVCNRFSYQVDLF